MITYKQVDSSYFTLYDTIPMLVHVKGEYRLVKHNNGLGGITFEEVAVAEYIKDLGQYEIVCEYEKRWNISGWAFFMAFDDGRPVGGTTIVTRTDGINMLAGRSDLAVLWDIRVDDEYKHRGIGQALFDMAVRWSKAQGMSQLKIECQNNNVPACRFYHKQGAVLGAIDEYAYFNEPKCRNEVQFIWYLNL
jgi:ribosomal protein S18 acetylase RimI-like enzyme